MSQCAFAARKREKALPYRELMVLAVSSLKCATPNSKEGAIPRGPLSHYLVLQMEIKYLVAYPKTLALRATDW